MIINSNQFIQEDAICYIRHLKNLSPGYQKSAYPDYTIFMPNKFYWPTENLTYFKLATYLQVDDIIPEVAHVGYPHASQISYYIKLKNVLAAQLREDVFQLYFSNDLSLYIYNEEAYKNLLEDLQDNETPGII